MLIFFFVFFFRIIYFQERFKRIGRGRERSKYAFFSIGRYFVVVVVVVAVLAGVVSS